MAAVIEFKTKEEYEEWLKKKGKKVKIINVSTTNRWNWKTGFLGDSKTYTITYEGKEEAPPADNSSPIKLNIIQKLVKDATAPYRKSK